jgi:serine/threonine protein kinase
LVGKSLPHQTPPEADAREERSADDPLFTAQDLFGDLVDAPLEPAAHPRGSGRVKVQVAEKNRPEDPPEHSAAEIPVEEMAGLVDAFGAGPSAAIEPDAVHLEPEPSAPLQPRNASGSEVVEGFDSLLGSLDPIAPPPPEPAKAPEPAPPRAASRTPARSAESFGDLLDNLTEAHAAETPEPVRTETANLPPPEPLSPLEGLPEASAPPAATAKPERQREPDVDQLLAGFLEGLPTTQAADVPPPVGRTKLRVEAPKVARQTAPELDLGRLADEALSATLAESSEALPAAPRGREPALPTSFGPYRLLERIAAGGMAEVFRAKRAGVEGFEKVVAVKRILPHLSDNKEFVEMFIDEAKMVAGLSHPNIVQIFDLGKIDTTYFIAMEHVHGKDLRTILKQAKEKGLRIPLDLSVLIVSKVCSALEYAHRKRDERGEAMRIVHRDISPQNILISFEGEVKLTDFGIAKATSKASSTDRGALRGKLLYMSPEQASGHPMDRRSDVFSLGVVFYEMITDTKPFLGSSEKGILEMVRDCRFERPRSLNPKIPESLEKVVLKALEKDPERRYQDASEMYRGLERVLRERQPPAATELARFMEVLFETGATTLHDEPSDEGIEIDLGPAETATSLPDTGSTGEEEDIDFDDLIKRIGK